MAVPKATTGPLTGFAYLSINISMMIVYIKAAIDKDVKYGFGSKDPNPGQWPIDYSEIDCSGFVRAILAYATCGQSTHAGMPDGSLYEDGWFGSQGFKRTSYYMCSNNDEHVRVGIHRPGGRGGDSTGHIWLVYHGLTLESCGGYGPHRQAWDNEWMLEHVDDCYVLC